VPAQVRDPASSVPSACEAQTGRQASVAALAVAHGGHASSVERDSENGVIWEVEGTRQDGSTVDVHLEQNYGLVVIEATLRSQ
jgi:hypothetical protein